MIPCHIPSGVAVIKEHHFDYASIRVRNDGIVQINSQEDVLFGLQESLLVHSKVNELNENKPMLILHVPGKHTNIDDETRKFLSSEKGVKNRLAFAFVLQSLGQKLVANFFLKVNKPKIPTRFFTSQHEAEKWLLSVKARLKHKKITA